MVKRQKFTPEQASEVMMALLDQKINLPLKLKGFSLGKKSPKLIKDLFSNGIKELEAESKNVQNLSQK